MQCSHSVIKDAFQKFIFCSPNSAKQQQNIFIQQFLLVISHCAIILKIPATAPFCCGAVANCRKRPVVMYCIQSYNVLMKVQRGKWATVKLMARNQLWAGTLLGPVACSRPFHIEGWKQKQRQRSSRLFGAHYFIQFLAALAVLPQSTWKKRLNLSFSFKSTEAKQQERPPKQMRRPLPLLVSPSFFQTFPPLHSRVTQA